jgi:hypothetical protein
MSVIEFPGHDREISEAEISERHSTAFRSLEGDISDCLRMVQLTARVMPDETDEHLMFAVIQTKEMLERLEKRYHALWYGEERP